MSSRRVGSRHRPGAAPTEIAGAVRAAGAGDVAAWDALVGRFSGFVWAVARSHGLSRADAEDVSQTTWLRLTQHLPGIREPASVGVWLATTARNESLRTLRDARRNVVYEPSAMDELAGADPLEPDQRVLTDERDAGLWEAFDSLPGPCRSLLRLLVADPPKSYAEVSAAMGRPLGSVGPMRQRCLCLLRQVIEAGLVDENAVGTAARPPAMAPT